MKIENQSPGNMIDFTVWFDISFVHIFNFQVEDTNLLVISYTQEMWIAYLLLDFMI